MQLNNITPNKPIAVSGKNPTITINRDRLKTFPRLYSLATILIPSLGSIVAIAIASQLGISLVEIGLLVSTYTLTMIGITVGYHRHFAHCSFQTNTAVRVILAILGSMAGQGPLIYWVATHRRHHQYSDLPGDAHSPNLHGKSIRNRLYGLFHSHIGWILDLELTNTIFFAKDLLRDPVISKINQLYFWWMFIGLVIPTVLGGLLTQTWMGSLSGFLWGGLVRIFLTQHFAYSINSICHLLGSRPFDTKEQSTNNIWIAIPSFGEGWHNNHHAFPNSAIFGLEWWQIDIGAWAIRVLEKADLVREVKAPTVGMIEAKKER
jgi:stearoyl-CoA desaturase (Delta-9 desaturase)